MLITEGLAELKTLTKRIEKKREHIKTFLHRQDGLRDPLASDGGSDKVIMREMQAIGDLCSRIVRIRTAIQKTNLLTLLTIDGSTQSIAEWLAWRKDISSGAQTFYRQIRQTIATARQSTVKQGGAIVAAGTEGSKPNDLVVNINESDFAKMEEAFETILGNLDGQLSLKNATIVLVGFEEDGASQA